MTTSPSSLWQLDGNNSMPLYMQLINCIKSAIDRNELQPGDAIPSERDLVESLNIARGTIRKAFQQLLEEGILVRNQGSGTFVAPHVRQSLPLLESFSEMANASGGKAQSELVGYLRRASTQKEREILRLADEQKEVVELTRLRKINGIAVSLQMAILPAHLLDKINELDESLYLYLEKKGSPVLRASQHFKAVMTDSKLAYYLGIKEHHPLLLVTRTGYTYHELPVEYTCTWCLNDYYDFTIELHRPQE
ncbi:GntR family transcriptional regulator [Rahnella sp. C60]|uniref:GntR family transcriptional regulator n=1 Tax=Rahnella perminowiae TaxID=2816244 RepID=UPI001C27A00B|nr:GntR family transcriptional regulator [Rahnella perminowiae]MBU9810334.1 GntR family transcriptional regulator [Rahnella perminowiae]MBU9816535.1 GntR family transcriptional regulator [Rahnella perminowiae]